MRERLRIVMSGMMAADLYQGGATWAMLQYVLGLRALGHDVLFIEPVSSTAPGLGASPLSESIAAQYFESVITRFDLADCAALLREDTRETVGMDYASLVRRAAEADLLINVSGMLTEAEIFPVIPRRLYLDLDPAFVQIWDAVEGIDMRLNGHTDFATVGLAIGTRDCDVPTCGRTWIPMLQPIVLAEWPATPCPLDAAWTTIGNWRGYGSVRYNGVTYGQKAHSFRRFIDLPDRTTARIQAALSIHPGETADIESLAAHHWDLVDPATVASTPDAYCAFIQESRGELGIAKSGYVDSRCGWFSDRSVCYLASGRPVVAQETGFGRFLPTGEGLFSFETADDAVDALEAVEADYPRHSRRAREIACEYFRADRVLPALLESIGTTPHVGSGAS